MLHGAGQAGLWQDPDLQVALKWHEQNRPNEVWARRYHPEFRTPAFPENEQSRARAALGLAGTTLSSSRLWQHFWVGLLARSDAKKNDHRGGRRSEGICLLDTKPALMG